jgi:hypothetical protein
VPGEAITDIKPGFAVAAPAGVSKPRTHIKWEVEQTFDTEEAAMQHATGLDYTHLRAQHGARVLKCALHEECSTGGGALLRVFPIPGGNKARAVAYCTFSQ